MPRYNRTNCKVTPGMLDGKFREVVGEIRKVVSQKAWRCGCSNGKPNLKKCFEETSPSPSEFCVSCNQNYTLQSDHTCAVDTTASAVAAAAQAVTDAFDSLTAAPTNTPTAGPTEAPTATPTGTWTRHSSKNCYHPHGASDDSGSIGHMSVDDCKRRCLGQGCDCIQMWDGECHLRKHCNIGQCQTDGRGTAYTYTEPTSALVQRKEE